MGVVWLGLLCAAWVTFSWPDRPMSVTVLTGLCTVVFLVALLLLGAGASG